MKAPIDANFTRNERLSQSAAYLVLALMMLCAGFTFDGFAARLSPAWPRGLMPWVAFLAAIEAMYSQNFVHAWSDFSWEKNTYRISEALVIVFSVKAAFFVQAGVEPFRIEIASYSTDFFNAFLSGSYLGLLVLTFIVWVFTSQMAQHLIELRGDREILEPGARPDFFSDRDAVRRRLAGSVLFFGALLVILATLTRSDLDLIWQNTPVVEMNALWVILYFGLGLILFSQGQFAVVRARWGWERTPIGSEISRNWLVYTGLFFLVLLAVVLVLPTGYSLNFMATFGLLMQLLYALIAFVVYLLFTPLILALAALTGRDPQEVENPLQDVFQPPDGLPDSAGALPDTIPWLELARSVVFWIAFLLVVAFAFYQFVRQNEVLWQRLMSIHLFQSAYELLQRFRAWLMGVGKGLASVVEAGLEQARQIGSRRGRSQVWNTIKFGRLAPRERVIFLYRAMVRRAGEQQVVRRGWETPAEYAAVLRDAFPEASTDIDELTSEFELARYGRGPVAQERVGVVSALWNRIRREIRSNGGK